jgi:broad specificity phosphatase PhoE
MPQLLLVRHAEPEFTGILLGRKDVSLSAEGRAMAQARLPAFDASVAYVSPLRRAQETAAFLSAGIPRVTLPDLAEIGLGQWEGFAWRQVEERWPEMAARKLSNWFQVAPPEGESWDQVIVRARNALSRIREGPFPAIVVAHQGIHSALAWLITGTGPGEFKQGYCEGIPYDF